MAQLIVRQGRTSAIHGMKWMTTVLAGARLTSWRNIAVTTTTCLEATTSKEDESFVDKGNDLSSFYSSSYHAPVMWKECIDALLSSTNDDEGETPDGVEDNTSHTDFPPRYFVDGTLGGGGHSEAILQHCRPQDVVFGCDQDPDAIATASERLQAYMNDDPDKALFVPVASNFCQLAQALPQVKHPHSGQTILSDDNPQVDGILLDLGVSSFQIDTATRGFAFMKDGPLDMRMNPNGNTLTAADLCNEFDAKQLGLVLRKFGDEKRHKAIANAIVQHRPLRTTGDLSAAIASVVPDFAKNRRQGRTATTARVFQALRMAVNQEDVVLAQALENMAPALIRSEGRLVVLTYHSIEDRMVKRVLRDGSIHRVTHVERDLYGNRPTLPWKALGKPQKATEAEVTANPRARSATLRVGVRQS